MNQQLIIIRHGEGEHLTEHFFSSRPSHPNYRPAHLTELGRSQALQAGQKLIEAGIHDRDIEVVLVSPLPRTRETAEGLCEGGKISKNKQVIEPLLIEISLGELEGTCTRKWINSGRNFTDFSDAHTYEGETNEDVATRMRALIEVIKKSYTTGHVVAVTHALPGFELSGVLTGEKTELAVAEALLLDMDEFFLGSFEPSDT